jgi:large subunit ribosomal protein L4
MSTVNVQSPSGDVAGTVELPSALFDVEVNIPLVHQVVVAQLAAARQGTHDTKSRGEVRGGGRKPYRQKGTGRARQGSTRAPQFVGGGVVHGPTPRSYAQRTPKKMKAAALRSALSDRARGGKLHVVSALFEGDVPSTKAAAATLASIASSRHVLVVLERSDVLNWKSLRNVETVHVIAPDQLNTYDVLVSDDVVFTEGSLAAFVAGGQPPSHAEIEAAVEARAAEFASRPKPAKKAEPAKKTAAKTTAKKAAAKKTAASEPAEEPEAPEATDTTEAPAADVVEPEAPAAEAPAAEPEAPAAEEPEAPAAEAPAEDAAADDASTDEVSE